MKRQSKKSDVPDPTLNGEEEENSPSYPKNGKTEGRVAHPWTIARIDGLKPIRKTSEFTLDLNVFNELVEATYRHLCGTIPDYSSHISMGMFSYYCGVALWYRLYAIRYAQGGDSKWLFPDLKLFGCSSGLILPKLFCKFLDMIGDFTEPNSRFYWKLTFPAFNSEYHFGEMSENSFPNYMAYPAPAVLIATLQQELGVIAGKEKYFSTWKLKAIDYKDCPVDRVFTGNVSGYYVPPSASVYKVKMDDPIGKELSAALDGFKKPNESMNPWICDRLIGYISKYNTEKCKDCPMQRYDNDSKYGSLIQMGFVELPNATDVAGYSPFMLPDSQGALIPVFRLRVKRNPKDKAAYPYDFPTIEDIPGSWPAKLNATFNYGNACSRWNLPLFSTGSCDRRSVITEYVQSCAAPSDD